MSRFKLQTLCRHKKQLRTAVDLSWSQGKKSRRKDLDGHRTLLLRFTKPLKAEERHFVQQQSHNHLCSEPEFLGRGSAALPRRRTRRSSSIIYGDINCTIVSLNSCSPRSLSRCTPEWAKVESKRKVVCLKFIAVLPVWKSRTEQFRVALWRQESPCHWNVENT